jgi:acyl-coenzyme A synthetase/AMP-(fatty) acid ligase
VHLNDVKTALLRADDVADAVVRVVDDGHRPTIAAAVALRGGVRPAIGERVVSAIATSLPPYMMPKLFLWCEEIPRLPTGKSDLARVSHALTSAAKAFPGRRFLHADRSLNVREGQTPYA